MRLSLRHAKRFALILTILVAIVGFVTWQNNCIVISKSSLSSEKYLLPFITSQLLIYRIYIIRNSVRTSLTF